VLHDDQHGTAVVALAGLINAVKRVGRSLSTSVVGQVGLGAAGLGIRTIRFKDAAQCERELRALGVL